MISILQHLSIASLQHLSAALAIAQDKDLSITDIRIAVDRQLSSIAPATRNTENVPESGTMCPSCGRDKLVSVLNREGMSIYGCRSCRYSEVR